MTGSVVGDGAVRVTGLTARGVAVEVLGLAYHRQAAGCFPARRDLRAQRDALPEER